MKKLLKTLTLIFLCVNTFGQTTANVNSNLVESNEIISFKPLDIMTRPESLMKVWINEPIPVDFYSEKEKEVQKLINEKTTDGIITYAPLDKEKEWTSIDYEEITPFTWKWVDFELTKPDGTLAKINLRRPHWWLQEMRIESVGQKVYLNIPEMGTQGLAIVTAIRINQLDTRFWNENRNGDYVSRPITGKFEHESNEVYNLFFSDSINPLGVTSSHPIWSIDRNSWVVAVDLKVGEKVKTQYGEVTLVSKEKVEGRQKVYNLEIYKDHNFLVSTNKILVHNNCITLPKVTKAVNSNLPHAIERGVERGIFKNADDASIQLKNLSNNIKNHGFPAGSIKDPAYVDRVLVPIGNNGMASYQVGANGTAKLKTVLIAK